MTEGALAGRRVLLVEDEMLVAMLVESALEDENCVVVGPYGGVREALEVARGESLDLAVLDINLAGELVFPVAEELEARGVPFLLSSDYGSVALPSNRRHWPICAKPFNLRELVAVLGGLLAGAKPRPEGAVGGIVDRRGTGRRRG
jgi:DNA-binding response OmpR family regulator